MTDVVRKIDGIRATFLQVLRSLAAIPSFQGLLDGSLKEEWNLSEGVAEKPNVKSPVSRAFTCAIVGGSNNGKTTILKEMFPALAARGWLITEVVDTTSQALHISFAPPESPEADRVLLHSWDYGQIKALVDLAGEDNRRDNVRVTPRDSESCIAIDGTEAAFTDRGHFQFPLEQTLRPLPKSPLDITQQSRGNREFITALTAKSPGDGSRRGPLLIGSESFAPLALRAIIRRVDLRDPFSEIIRWARTESDLAAALVFLDTPGLNVEFSTDDEILRHVLSRKNQQIIAELIKQDELDIIIHLVLVPNTSTFSALWDAVSEQPDAAQLADLEERIILVMNGFNRYLKDPNLVKRWNDPANDHFAFSIEGKS